MKKLILIIIVMSVANLASSQGRNEKLGTQEFEMFSYPSAISYLERVANKSAEVNRILAKSHLFIGNLSEAAQYFEQVTRTNQVNAEDYWQLAQAQMGLERYREATVSLQRMLELAPSDSRAIRYSQAGDFVNDLKERQSNISIRYLRTNGDHQDFGPIYYRDQIVFTSSRINGMPDRGVWTGNELPFLRLYNADIESNGDLGTPRPFLPDLLTSDFHVGPIAINKKENMMAVTVNFEQERRKPQTVNLMILVSYFRDGKWSELQKVPFNDPEYSVGHPTFSPDGDTMYFASDMPGGKGGTDIYKVSILPNSGWGSPQNVSDLNTEGDEMFPFYHDNNMLFFASDGHVGLGGLDVFYARVSNGEYHDITNMGYPINSSLDDFSIIIDQDFRSGYFASNRTGGKGGNDDLYYFSLIEPLIEVEQPVAEVVTPAIVAPGETTPTAATLTPVTTPTTQPQPVFEPGQVIQINPIYFDYDKSNIRPDAARELGRIVETMNSHPTMRLELGSHTDCRGTDMYNALLSVARMESSLRYIRARISNPGRIIGHFYGKTRLINDCDCTKTCSEEEHQLNRRTEFTIVSM